ncbi:Glucose-6-phosphate 1-dehydrogenase [Trachipleistophora hominis]|uniref:Glucose-6-phosphate 1-dehydrogenase n=1 Tax=Trachipleistophora hominis TaxID=72359 RepID=L7JXW6_TRAHO|nr:Glucose-6-phosphate 1-dehydrogenase [Trachipleistophora hominis]
MTIFVNTGKIAIFRTPPDFVMDKIFIIFGASGNLSKVKLLPSILKEKLYKDCEIVLYSRNVDDDVLQAQVKEVNDKNLRIVQGQYTDTEKIAELINGKKLVIFYLCIPSHQHLTIIQSLDNLNREVVVALEKPFLRV